MRYGIALAAAATDPDTRQGSVDFFHSEYETDNFIAKMKTPVITFMNGITSKELKQAS